MIEKNIKDDFLDLFYNDLCNEALENNNTLNLFTLKVKNNAFSYDELINELGNKLCYFALSRKQVDELKQADKFNDLVKKAKAKLKHHADNEGELGEILLYCLLESHLNAPKILTKLELKTNSNDYIKGADGVHLLKLSDTDYQIVLGESKLNSDISKGVYEAFGSISKFLKSTSKLEFEIDLINSELVKEAYDQTTYEMLKRIIIPSAKEDDTYLDYSFGIFLGFDIPITDEESKLNNSDFRKNIREKIKKEVLKAKNSLNHQLKKSDYTGYQFYIYVIPFSDLQNKRKHIIGKIVE
ncbi:HamA C-terminal domain-containing protein [Chryseobacterium sp. Mn2064]|uniref:HamA C-terminal domain-containing protein n=1 Tax=Chryseobacterium sp. Mn2064 TaxID=3395263 RepID=UPI003BC8281B